MPVFCYDQPMRVPLSKLTPAPWNPRLIKDNRFKALCKSMENDPEFVELRPVLATKDGTIYGGNMRYRAAEHLGWNDVPAVLSDIPEQLAKERAVKDNGNFGEWDDSFSSFLDSLIIDGVDMETLGLSEAIQTAVKSINEPAFNAAEEWQGMPEYISENQLAYRQIIISFQNEDDIYVFASLIQQPITEKTKSLWFPKAEQDKVAHKRYQ
jgi:ParB-like chromosome segregation protein Spo0J